MKSSGRRLMSTTKKRLKTLNSQKIYSIIKKKDLDMNRKFYENANKYKAL